MKEPVIQAKTPESATDPDLNFHYLSDDNHEDDDALEDKEKLKKQFYDLIDQEDFFW